MVVDLVVHEQAGDQVVVLGGVCVFAPREQGGYNGRLLKNDSRVFFMAPVRPSYRRLVAEER